MKASKIIICLLAVTFFVACSKKKDGNSNPYNGNPYGLAPNDIRANGLYPNGIPPTTGVYQQPVMPGYQTPQCGAGQMFPDAISYCAWLATDGEKVCNPLVVKQLFMQYCQMFAVRYNYCVPMVQSGCYYNGGCSVGSSVIRYHDTKKPRYEKPYTGDDDTVGGSKPVYTKPVYTQPVETQPVVTQPVAKNNCVVDASRDCKQKYSKSKKSELVCKLPNDAASEENYLYSYNEYLSIANSECNSATASTVKQTTVYTQPATTVNTTTTTAATSSQSKGRTVYIMQDDLQKTATTTATTAKVKAAPVAACLNLQEMHENILNPANKLSSLRIHVAANLSTKSNDKAFATQWTERVKSVYNSKYLGSTELRNDSKQNNNTTAIGINVKQTSTTLKSGNATGQIVGCNEKQLVAKFKTAYGYETVTYNWNGMQDEDFEMLVTKNGSFSYNGKSDTYMISSYIGLTKDRSNEISKDDQFVHKKVLADMQSKGIECEDTVAYKKSKGV